LLYGRNNAGKSAVLRLLPILADSLADGSTSSSDIGRVADGASFLDLPSRTGKAASLKQMTLMVVWKNAEGQHFRVGRCCSRAAHPPAAAESEQRTVARHRPARYRRGHDSGAPGPRRRRVGPRARRRRDPTPVDIDQYGRPLQGWPQAAFEEDQALARRLLNQQLQDGAFG